MCRKDFIHIQPIRKKDNSFYRNCMYYKISTPVQEKLHRYTNAADYEAIKSVILQHGTNVYNGTICKLKAFKQKKSFPDKPGMILNYIIYLIN